MNMRTSNWLSIVLCLLVTKLALAQSSVGGVQSKPAALQLLGYQSCP